MTKSLLIQYLISYIIILFIPLIVLVLFIQLRFQSALISELQTNSRQSLSTLAIKTEQKIETYQRISQQMSINEYFYSPLDPSKPEDYLEVKEEMNSYAIAANAPFVAVYWENSDFLFTNTGSCAFRLLSENLRSKLSSQTSEIQIFLSDLYPMMSQQKNSYFIIYAIPFTANYSSLQKISGYLLFAEAPDQLMANFPMAYETDPQLYVCAGKEDQIYGDSVLYEIQEKMAAAGLSPTSPISLFVSNNDYLLNVEYLETGDLTFYSITPSNLVLEPARELRNETILVIIITFALASILIFVMIRYNYSPINKLLGSMEHLFSKEQKNLNRIEAAQQAVRNLEQQNILRKENSRKYTQEELLRQLLDGSSHPEELADKLASHGIVFDKPYFSVCCLQMEQEDRSGTDVLAFLRQVFSGCCTSYVVRTINRSSFVAITNFDDSEDTYKERLEELRERIGKKLGCAVTLSAGGIYENYGQIYQAYREAIYAMDYRYITSTDCLIYYSEISTQDESFNNYPYQQLERLHDCFIQHDLNAIEKQLRSILDFITTCGVPLFVARRISYDIVNMVLSSLNDEELSSSHSYISSLAKFTTIQDLADAVYNIYHNLIVLSGNMTATKQDTLSEMKHYIQKHYTDPEFSLQIMAEYFGMSMTGLSQYFKKNSGQTLIEYYTMLRLDLARELLSQHKYKIDEIASMTGYTNTSSFIRRFKQLTGMSPGAFAQQNAPSQNTDSGTHKFHT